MDSRKPTAQIAASRPADAANRREHEALDEQLTEQPPAARAERGADRHFLLPLQRPREQQIRDVRADDHQHEEHRPEQHEQRRPQLRADERVGERDQVDAPVLHLRILLADARGDGIHLGLGGAVG